MRSQGRSIYEGTPCVLQLLTGDRFLKSVLIMNTTVLPYILRAAMCFEETMVKAIACILKVFNAALDKDRWILHLRTWYIAYTQSVDTCFRKECCWTKANCLWTVGTKQNCVVVTVIAGWRSQMTGSWVGWNSPEGISKEGEVACFL